jgi:adenylate kinase
MNLIILGPQGSGKGTQAEMLAKKFDLEHIDMGKFLREVAKIDTPLGREVYDIQNVTKTLVPAKILEEVFTIKLNGISREKGVIFDGFPRNMDQAEYLEKAVKEFGRQIDKVVFVNISKDESLKRISKRWICEKCKSVWIMGKDVKNENDKCPNCQGNIMQRIDDVEEGIKIRLKVFEEETIPVIRHFYDKGKIVEINGAQTIEKVFEDILRELKNSNLL